VRWLSSSVNERRTRNQKSQAKACAPAEKKIAKESTIALTNSSGAVQTTYSYGPFGQTASSGSSSDNPYQFTGHEFETATVNGFTQFSMYNFRARYLDTTTGRFAS